MVEIVVATWKHKKIKFTTVEMIKPEWNCWKLIIMKKKG